MEIVIKICAFIGTFLGFLQIYKVIYAFGVLTHKKYKKSDVQHSFGICVAARNEDKVITGLLESINQQNYDKSKIKVFVCAHNCTDNTALICQEYTKNCNFEINVFEHNCSDEKTKGFALRYLFNKIKENNLDQNLDGYFVFDADNVLKADYIEKMNDAFSEGNKIITSFRNSKNLSQNWISFSYAIHWLRTCLLEHRGTTLFNLSCRIQGTGFLFAKELVKDGWNWTSLTEDRAFCTDAVIKDYKVCYCEEAEFFDEQPYTLKVALRQRVCNPQLKTNLN